MLKIRYLCKSYLSRVDPSLPPPHTKKVIIYAQKISGRISKKLNSCLQGMGLGIWGKKSYFNAYPFILFEFFIMLMYYIFCQLLFFLITDTTKRRAVARNIYCRNCYKMYQSYTVSSENSTVLSFFDKLISNFILPHKVKYLRLFKKLVTFRALCLCLAYGHTQSTAHTCVVFAQRHTHPRTSGFCSLRADLVLKEKKISPHHN